MTYLRFKATVDQLQTIAAAVTNAAEPVGLGILHFKDQRYLPNQFNATTGKSFHIDYVEGRMVKLNIFFVECETYEIQKEIRSDYQSWKRVFPDCTFLLAACGIHDYEVIEK